MSKQVHIMVASQHLEANIIPLLQLKPEVGYILVSESMVEKSQQLKKIISNALPECKLIEKLNFPDSDIEAIESFIVHLSDDLDINYPESDGWQRILNTTGGTKLMALLLTEFFNDNWLYTDTANRKLVKLKWQGDKGSSQLPMASVLTAQTYLKANGKTIRSFKSDSPVWIEVANARKSLTKMMARAASDGTQPIISNINYLISTCGVLINAPSRNEADRFDPYKAQQKLHHPPKKNQWQLLQKMVDHEVIDWDSTDPQQIIFKSLETINYLHGFWLEEYAWHCGIDAGADEVLCGVDITDDSAPKADVRNDIDCIIVHQNKMMVIECKTSAHGKDETKDTQVLERLNGLKSSGGLYATGVLLTSQPFGKGDNYKRNKGRAQSFKIDIIEENEVKQFSNFIKEKLNL